MRPRPSIELLHPALADRASSTAVFTRSGRLILLVCRYQLQIAYRLIVCRYHRLIQHHLLRPHDHGPCHDFSPAQPRHRQPSLLPPRRLRPRDRLVLSWRLPYQNRLAEFLLFVAARSLYS